VGRKPYVAGNWKMHLDRAGAVALASAVAERCGGVTDRVDVGVCPTHLHLDAVAAALRSAGAAGVRLGTQDLYPGEQGAFTGEVSAWMLRDLGVATALTGHSERRHVLGETDAIVRIKTLAALEGGLECVLCVGETLEQREAGETDAVNERQVRAGLEGVTPGLASGRLVIAYEPVWAIGTGKTASADDAQQAQAKIRAVLGDVLGAEVAAATRILYGGSVKPDNAAGLFAQPDVDGGLIGGASLKPDSFEGIVRAAVEAGAG
jgi:triosephosphate isomerase